MKTVINISEEAYKYVKENGHMHSRNLVEIDNAIYNSELYEARLKADMVDILLDVQNEIKQKELEAWGYPNIEYSKGLKLTVDIIQKKIRALKENKDAI